MMATSTSPAPRFEQRAEDRHPARFALNAHLLSGDLVLNVRDVSARGVYLHSRHAPAVGQALHVSTRLDGVHTLEAVATVVRVDPGRGFAARLSVVGREGRLQWAQHLAALRGAAVEADPTLGERDLDPTELFDFAWVNDEGDELP